MKKPNLCLLIAVFCFLVETLYATDKAVYVDKGTKAVDILSYGRYYVDKSGNLPVKEVDALANTGSYEKFFTVPESSPMQLGYSHNTVWLRFELAKTRKPKNPETLWYLEVLNPATSYVDIYYKPPQRIEKNTITKIYSGGALRDPKDNKYHTTFFTDISPYMEKGGVFYIELRSRFSMIIGAQIINQEAFSVKENKDRILSATMLGMILSLFLFNLFFYFFSKDKAYLFYTIYTLFSSVTITSNAGYVKIIFSKHPLCALFLVNIALSIWVYSQLMFVKVYLNLPRLHKGIDRIINGFIVFWIFWGVFNWWIPPAIFYNVLEVLGLFSLLIVTYAGFLSLFSGYRPARFFLLGYAVFFTAFVVYLLQMINVLSISVFSFFLLLPGLGLLGETTLFSFGLASRYNEMKKEHENFIKLQRDMEFAVETQKHLFPQKILNKSSFKIKAMYFPSTQMCGDFYDVIEDEKSHTTTVFIADVAGHGYAASIVGAMVKVAFRESYDLSKPVSVQIARMNDILINLVRDTFVTAGILRVNTKTLVAHYAQAGHMPLLLLDAKNRSIKPVKPNGYPLALGEYKKWKEVKIKLKKEKRLFMYTDGLIDMVNEAGERFGEERLHAMLYKAGNFPRERMAGYIKTSIKKWDNTGLSEPKDDVTFIICDTGF